MGREMFAMMRVTLISPKIKVSYIVFLFIYL